MNVSEAIKKRRSIRRFQNAPLGEDEINLLCDALIWAPSAGNLQARRFCLVLNAELKRRIATVCMGQSFIAAAPLVVVAIADYERIKPYRERGKSLYVVQDAACAVENMMLQACELGLGSVWVGAFDENALSSVLELPQTQKPLAVVPVGRPAERPEPPRRYPVAEIIRMIE